jgi:hypothetical protein
MNTLRITPEMHTLAYRISSCLPCFRNELLSCWVKDYGESDQVDSSVYVWLSISSSCKPWLRGIDGKTTFVFEDARGQISQVEKPILNWTSWFLQERVIHRAGQRLVGCRVELTEIRAELSSPCADCGSTLVSYLPDGRLTCKSCELLFVKRSGRNRDNVGQWGRQRRPVTSVRG